MSKIKLFKQLVSDIIQRDGIENLMEWLENETDFFKAPASTRYHGSYEGGLLEHSLNVHDRLLWEMENLVGKGWEEIYSPETIAIVALFHDLCKIDRYILVEKWRKDSDGQWESYDAYDYNREKSEMGHAAQSVFYLQKFIQLSEVEAQAIYWHMGAYDISPYSTLAHCSETFKWNPLAFLTHRADMAATYVSENEAFVFGSIPEEVSEVEELEEVTEVEEKPARARRRGAKKESPKEDHKDKVVEEEEEEKPTRITRRKKATPKKEEPEEVVEEVEEKSTKSSIRMPRKGAAKKSAKKEEPKTYYFYNEEDDFYYKKDVNEPEDDNDILVDEEEYLDTMCPILEEDFFYQLGGKAYKLAAGERLPEEYDEETWEPITEEKFEEMTAEPKKTSVRASRKKPTPSRRPRP